MIKYIIAHKLQQQNKGQSHSSQFLQIKFKQNRNYREVYFELFSRLMARSCLLLT